MFEQYYDLERGFVESPLRPRIRECMERYNTNEPDPAKHITKAKLAKSLGVAPSTVTRWIDGDRTPQLATAFAIARCLKCEVSDLFEFDPE